MMNVIWQPKALKHLKKIGDRSAQERILAATRGLAAFPACPNIKSLTNHEYTHRLRQLACVVQRLRGSQHPQHRGGEKA